MNGTEVKLSVIEAQLLRLLLQARSHTPGAWKDTEQKLCSPEPRLTPLEGARLFGMVSELIKEQDEPSRELIMLQGKLNFASKDSPYWRLSKRF